MEKKMNRLPEHWFIWIGRDRSLQKKVLQLLEDWTDLRWCGWGTPMFNEDFQNIDILCVECGDLAYPYDDPVDRNFTTERFIRFWLTKYNIKYTELSFEELRKCVMSFDTEEDIEQEVEKMEFL